MTLKTWQHVLCEMGTPFWVVTVASEAIFDLMRTIKSERWTVGLYLGALVLGIACVLFGRFGAPRVARVGLAMSLVLLSVVTSIWLTIFILPSKGIFRTETWTSLVLNTVVFGVFLIPLLCGALPWVLTTAQAWWARPRVQ